MLRVVGKYINGSGIDEALIEAEIYGPTTMEQIKAGKHCKRCFEAILTAYLALNSLYLKNFFEENIILKVACEEAIDAFKNHTSLSQLANDLDNLQLFKALEEFDKSLGTQAKYLRKFMHLVELILLFQRGTRQGIWELHLSSLELFTKFSLRSIGSITQGLHQCICRRCLH